MVLQVYAADGHHREHHDETEYEAQLLAPPARWLRRLPLLRGRRRRAAGIPGPGGGGAGTLRRALGRAIVRRARRGISVATLLPVLAVAHERSPPSLPHSAEPPVRHSAEPNLTVRLEWTIFGGGLVSATVLASEKPRKYLL